MTFSLNIPIKIHLNKNFWKWSQLLFMFISQDGNMPLHLAAASANSGAHKICKALLEHKADPTIKDSVWILEQMLLKSNIKL